MCRTGESVLPPELTCRFGRSAVCAAAGVWIKAMASATLAVVRFLYVMDAPLSRVWSLPGRSATGIAAVNAQKIGTSREKVVRTDRIGPFSSLACRYRLIAREAW